MSRTSSSQAATTRQPSRQRSAIRSLLFALVGALLFGGAQAQNELNVVLTRGSLATQPLIVGGGYRPLSLVNQNNETTNFTVYRLNNDASLDNFVAAKEASGAAAIEDMATTATALSGVSVSKHSSKTMMVDLERGTYVIAATPKSGGAVAYSTFEVIGGGETAAAPQVPNEVSLTDLAFKFPTEVDAGANLWKVSNTGTQPQVVDFYRLLPGRSVDDLIAYLGGNGARAPYDETANIAMVAAGETVYVPVDLKAGDWVALSSAPDMNSPELTHVMEGMASEFRVY